MNDDTNGEPTDRIERPLAVAVRTSGLVLGGLAVPAIVMCARYNRLLGYAAWGVVALVAVGLVSICFAYAYLGARVGARRANNVLVAIVTAVFLFGLWMLSPYIGGRR